MFIFARQHHSPDAEGYLILVPMDVVPDAEGRFGLPIYDTSGDRGQHKRSHHMVGMLTLLHGVQSGNRRTQLFMAAKHGLTEAEKGFLLQEIYLLMNAGDCTNDGLRGEHMDGWFMRGSFYPRDRKPQDVD